MESKWRWPLWRFLGRDQMLRLIGNWNVGYSPSLSIILPYYLSGEVSFLYSTGDNWNLWTIPSFPSFGLKICRKLSDYGLSGQLGYQLGSLTSVTTLWEFASRIRQIFILYFLFLFTCLSMLENITWWQYIFGHSTVIWARTTLMAIFHINYLPMLYTCKSAEFS